MRHANKTKYLGRTAPHRKAMLANMASSLIQHKRIKTTVAKAKALKRFVEPLITKAKTDDTHNRRIAFRYLRDKSATAELFREVVDKVGDRPGGYTRIIRLGNRLGDNAEMCMIELVDFNEVYTKDKKTKSRRSRRGGKKAGTSKASSSQAAPAEGPSPKEDTASDVDAAQEGTNATASQEEKKVSDAKK